MPGGRPEESILGVQWTPCLVRAQAQTQGFLEYGTPSAATPLSALLAPA